MAISSDNFKKQISNVIAFARENVSTLSSKVKARVTQFLKSAVLKLREIEAEEEKAVGVDEGDTVPDTARLLWVAAGGDPNIFVQYLGQFPDPALAALQRDPSRLQSIIKQLSREIPGGVPQSSSEGIPSSWLPSSNVYGFKYDPSSKRMFVKFNGKDTKASGSTYVYDNVPKEIAGIVASGSIPAKTTGKNKWGSWWETKSPSVGSSVNALLVKGGFPYRKVS